MQRDFGGGGGGGSCWPLAIMLPSLLWRYGSRLLVYVVWYRVARCVVGRIILRTNYGRYVKERELPT